MDLQSVRASFIVQPSVSGYEPDDGEAIHLLESRAK
jgi:nucleotide-binding universal stress UspA family protein